MKPVVDRLEKQYKGKIEFRLVNVDTDQRGGELMQQFGTQYVPTFVFISSDGTTAGKRIGETSEQQMRSALDALK